MHMSAEVLEKQDYVVADLGLAEFGRKELDLAFDEMPGLVATIEKYKDYCHAGTCQPFKRDDVETAPRRSKHISTQLFSWFT